MRLFISLVVLIVCLYTCECRRQHPDYEKKDLPTANLFHKGAKYDRSGRREDRRALLNKIKGKHDFKPANAAWMRLPDKKQKCKTVQCGHKEFCLVNPKTLEEKCMSRRNFREGRRLFKTFHKKKAMLKDKSKIKELEDKLLNAEHMQDVYELMKDFKRGGKFGKYGKHRSHDRKQHPAHKEIKQAKEKHVSIVKSPAETNQERLITEATNAQECRPHEFYALRSRLVNWFVMLHTESRQGHHMRRKFNHPKKQHGDVHKQEKYDDKHHKHMGNPQATEEHGRCTCSKSVMWEFRKQDVDSDSHLSHTEIANMESNRREPCMKPFLKSCDFDGDARISHGEWCCCFTNTPTPCEEKKKLSDAKDWVPQCDKEGFYEREQCHDGHCWCVDLNGNYIGDTKVKGLTAHCGKYDPNGHLIKA